MGANCRIQGYLTDSLEFTLLNSSQELLSTNTPPAADGSRSYKFIQGEGNAPGALLSLDGSNNVQLEMFCTRNIREGTLALSWGIVGERSNLVSSQVATLLHAPFDEKEFVDVCINGQCNTETWEAGGEGGDKTGGPVYGGMVIGTVHERIHSLRIVVPNDSTHYEFQGDVDGILQRICRNE